MTHVDKPSKCKFRVDVAGNNPDHPSFVVFYHMVNDAVMRFFVLEVIRPDWDNGALYYESNTEDKDCETTDPDKAGAMLNGSVKWDGCSDMDIGFGISYRNHFCGLEDAKIIGQMIDKVYELAELNISGWDG